MAGTPIKTMRREVQAARAEDRAVDPAVRAKVVARAGEIGASAVAEEVGLDPALVRKWISRAKAAVLQTTESQPEPIVAATAEPEPEAADEDIDDLLRHAAKLDRAGDNLIARLDQVALTAKSPYSLAVAAGISIEKAILLRQRAQELGAGKVVLSEENGRLMAAVFRMVFDDALRVPWTEALGAVVADVLRQAGRGEALSPPEPSSQQAQDELRAYFAQRLTLPSPAADEPEAASEGEVVDAVVVDEPSAEPEHDEIAAETDAEVAAEPAEEPLTPQEQQGLDAYLSMYGGAPWAKREWIRAGRPTGPSRLAGFQPSIADQLR